MVYFLSQLLPEYYTKKPMHRCVLLTSLSSAPDIVNLSPPFFPLVVEKLFFKEKIQETLFCDKNISQKREQSLPV